MDASTTEQEPRHAYPLSLCPGAARLMAGLPPDQRGSWKDFLLFAIKAAAMLAGIFAFGFVIFWMRRATI